MSRVPWSLATLVLLIVAATPARAVDYLFAFHAGSTASVYDADTLTLVGTPTVGPGAVDAIGVPDPDQPGELLKIYVITLDTVVTLNPTPPFAMRRIDPLSGAINAGERSAVLTPDGKRLLVVASSRVFAFDADNPNDAAPALIEMGGTPTAVASVPDSSIAYVSVEGKLELPILSLQTDPPQRLEGPPELPAIPAVVGAAPNSAGVYPAASGGAALVDPLRNVVVEEIALGPGTPMQVGFDGEAPLDEMFVASGNTVSIVNIDRSSLDFVINPPVVIEKALSPTSDLFYIFSSVSSQVFKSRRDGSDLDVLRDPLTGVPFSLPFVDIELGRAHNNLFLALGESGSLMRISADASTFGAETTPQLPPTGIAVVSTPGTVTALLETYGGNGQSPGVGQKLPRLLSVRAVDADGRGVFGQTINFVSFQGNVVIVPATTTTNIDGEASAEATVPTSREFQIEARTPQNLTTRFDVNSGDPERAGLLATSGDFQVALQNTDFPRRTVIRTVTGGVPIPDNDLTITSSDSAVVICPATATTDEEGEASFQCTAGDIGGGIPDVVTVDVFDEFNRRLPNPLTFTVFGKEEQLPTDPTKITRGLIEGVAGGMVEDAIELRVTSSDQIVLPVRHVGAEFDDPRNVATFDPIIAPSGLNGEISTDAHFNCRLGSGTITSSLNTPGLPETEFDYVVIPGPPTAMSKVQGNNQSGDAGDLLPEAVVARVTDSCGNAVGGVPTTWEISPLGAATLEGAFDVSNGDGLISTRVRLGSRAGPITLTARAGEGATTFDAFVNVTASQLNMVSGDMQQLPAGGLAAERLVVALLSDSGAGAENEAVTFTVLEGGAEFDSASTVNTDEFGRASVAVRSTGALGVIRVEAQALEFRVIFNMVVVGRTPVVSSIGFVNGASFLRGWTPGSTGTIFGVGLMEGIDGQILPGVVPFPTEVRGVRVIVNGVAAPILGLININGQEQINIQVPFFTEAPSDNVTVTIENNGASASFTGVGTSVAETGVFIVFERPLPEGNLAAALHLDGSLIEPGNPARDGEAVQLFFTGGGPIEPILGTNQAGPVSPLSHMVNTPAVTLEGELQEVLDRAVYAPGLVSVYQVNFRVKLPPDSAGGNVPLSLNVLGLSAPETFMPVVP